MKRYIDADKLKAEIERRNLSNYYVETEDYEQKLYEIIDSLQQEQPEGGFSEKPNDLLSEAAKDSWAVYEYRESPRGLYSTCYVDGFKAGAEWMVGKFQKIEGCLVDWYSTSDGKDYCCGIKTNEAFEVPEGFYIRKKQPGESLKEKDGI